MTREQVATEDLVNTADSVTSVLRNGTDADWSQPAGPIRLTRLRTACHMADNCLAYAGQIASARQQGYLPFRTLPGFVPTPAGMLDFIRAAARVLAATSERYRDVIAWHPFGMSDVEGFVAMATAEIMVHGWDLASGLGLDLQPDRIVCARVMDRLAPGDRRTEDPWIDLLTFCNRLPAGKRSRRSWRYHSSPLQ